MKFTLADLYPWLRIYDLLLFLLNNSGWLRLLVVIDLTGVVAVSFLLLLLQYICVTQQWRCCFLSLWEVEVLPLSSWGSESSSSLLMQDRVDVCLAAWLLMRHVVLSTAAHYKRIVKHEIGLLARLDLPERWGWVVIVVCEFIGLFHLWLISY